MATFHPVIRTTQKRKDGTFNVKIRVTHNRRVGYLPTEHYIFEKEIEENGKINSLSRSWQDADDINMDLLAKIGQCADKIKKSKEQIKHYTLPALLEYLRDERDSHDLITVLDKKIDTYTRLGNRGYADMFKQTKALLISFGYKSVPLESINKDWVDELKIKLAESGLAPSTIGIRLRDIRTAYNTNPAYVDPSLKPFKDCMPKGYDRKRNIFLTDIEMANIIRVELPNKYLAWARDMFVLCFYLVGPRPHDLIELKEIKNNRIPYTSFKTGIEYSILVQPEAKAIIDRYPGDGYVLNAMNHYKHYQLATSFINRKLKIIARKANVDQKITLYFARKSWANISINQSGGTFETAKYGLGHSTKDITDFYINFMLPKIDQANRDLLDHMNKVEIPKESEKPLVVPLPPVKTKVSKTKKPLF